jgi:hypothetical protein
MAAELGPFIQEEHAVVGERHLAGHRDVAAADQPRIRDSMVGGAKRARRDQRRAVAGEAGDAVEARDPRTSVSGITGRMVNGGGLTSTYPPKGGRARADYDQNACIAFSFASTA